MSENTDNKKRSAPYLAFLTFLNALDNVAAHGVPNFIDRSSFPSFSGGAVAATLSAFRFFELIHEDGRPTERLHEIAKNADSRQQNIKSLLNAHYKNLIALDLSRATPSQFDNEFSSDLYNVNGDTRVKAKTFFIKAAQYADIPISKLILSKARSSAPRKPKKPKTASVSTATVAPTIIPEAIPNNSIATKIVRLSGGGNIMLTASVDVLNLSGKDRDFVFRVIDLLNDYDSEVNAST